jgi:hypothetical protein
VSRLSLWVPHKGALFQYDPPSLSYFRRPNVNLIHPLVLRTLPAASMNKTVINYVLPRLLPEIAAGSAAEPGVIDIFDALGGAGLTQPSE